LARWGRGEVTVYLGILMALCLIVGIVGWLYQFTRDR
jgi:hypothetical protein